MWGFLQNGLQLLKRYCLVVMAKKLFKILETLSKVSSRLLLENGYLYHFMLLWQYTFIFCSAVGVS